MKLLVKQMTDEELEKRGYMDAVKFTLADNGETVTVELVDGEPEDNNLGRNFSGVWAIPDLIKMAHKAGKEGRGLKIVHEDYSFK